MFREAVARNGENFPRRRRSRRRMMMMMII